ncbi:MAG: (deoxy)nucleoside triphosphate pyrophosphohydrolase [Acholeplasmatales bacterium]|jgi:8-oxo-dGTP diphosphatase|nr:(deoxy)nucleoside triphosphate pyrophosphohydrolase [Acholeplasmataceae bacterium]MCK9233789.1 (deoxy)nucleoside triphosphate pyrophosphohydrolase [Acholeplasmataceae bacterium]MCK9289711.1 (deoxy)nucleoside triphosphate pyrophosphohydrolase [Acholeplasmataceae bacterium]MCK9428050.1 (deoxy)nucleoside triphosphate pyrophosphohydrolase [Acholeplasmataceae bacterium]MDY0115692.1 (deoxy)nucleoside triphosphate pyrophosphohydrolase [Acholeplasmatales bacterium]
MKKQIEVCAALIKKDDKYFVVQRGPKGEVAFKWEFPGGKIEKNETHKEALKREIKEELNVDIEVNDFLMTVNHEYQTFNLTMHAYNSKIIAGTLKMREDQNNCLWLKPTEMNNYDFAAADLPIIEKLIKRAKDNKR